MNLVIVESPTKARTLSRFLGKDYQIQASMGHVLDLPKSKLGVDIEHDFSPQYELIPDKKKIVARLRSAAKGVEKVILATDPDREGEAIAWHIAGILTMEDGELKIGIEDTESKIERKKIHPQTSNFKDPSSTLHFLPSISRIVFHEITKEAIEAALKNPRGIDQYLVGAQTARRVLDRLVGYKLSPLLWKKVRRGLSAGRVQSVTLRLIVEREREIERFQKEPYYKIVALLTSNKQQLTTSPSTSLRASKLEVSSQKLAVGTEFELTEINGEKVEKQEVLDLYDGQYRVTKTIIESEEQAKKIVEELKKCQFIVSDVLQKEAKRTPPPPFTTSTLQQEAARRLGFSGKKTMSLAQKLYEEGFITYHRTDSVTMAKPALFAVRNFIKKEFGEKFLPEKPRFYQTKQKLAQEAHEAIRPTDVNKQQTTINKQLGKDYGKLYELIWKRTVASQMAEAIIESTTVFVDARGPAPTFPPAPRQSSGQASAVYPERSRRVGSPSSRVTPRYRFKASGAVLIFEGFLKVYPQALGDKKLPKFKVLESLDLQNVKAEMAETQPPPRYNYASLVATLEEKGIGRPSTYAPIISTLEERHYVELDPSAGSGRGRFVPTPVGMAVNDFLVANFPDIDDIPFTAKMEDSLDEIAQGEKEWPPVIREFYLPFEKKLEMAEKSQRVKIAVEKTLEVCDKCGSPMVIRLGKYGRFLSCSRFPECDFKKPIIEETNLVCPKDGGKIIIKKTKKGRRFYGCSNYPVCNFAAWRKEEVRGT